MAYDPNSVFQKLEPLPTTDGAWGWYDDEITVLYVPTEPRPKGSAHPIPSKDKDGNAVVRFIPGSDKQGTEKLKLEDKAIRQAVAGLQLAGFVAYDAPVCLDVDFIFPAPKARLKEICHTTYPDRDKLLRAVQDMISPTRVARRPDLSSPYMVTNDSQIYGGYTMKWWMHTWNKVTGLRDDDYGIYMVIRP